MNPPIGFNLHNQNWRTSVGKTGKPAAMSLLAVSFDEARSDNPGRIRAKKVASVIRDAVEPLAPGMIGRYDDEFEVRAFGDNLTKWGTSVVLIETGPYPGPDPDRALVRMNFVALLTSLDALASGRVDRADPARYETLPFNDSNLLHTIIAHATHRARHGVAPFLGDIGIAGVAGRARGRSAERQRGVRRADRGTRRPARLRRARDHRRHGPDRRAAVGQDAEGGRRGHAATGAAGRTSPVIAPGQPAAVVLLRPTDGREIRRRANRERRVSRA